MIQYVRCQRHTVDGVREAFAFFDTVRDRFVVIGSDQIFETIQDLLDAAHSEPSMPRPVAGLIRLIPPEPPLLAQVSLTARTSDQYEFPAPKMPDHMLYPPIRKKSKP
jgi:hypothetical protein